MKRADPPPRGRAPYEWRDIATRLRKKPDEWHLIFTQDKATYVTALRAGSIVALAPDKGFEFTTRNNTRGEPRLTDLYARYNPSLDLTKEKEAKA